MNQFLQFIFSCHIKCCCRFWWKWIYKWINLTSYNIIDFPSWLLPHILLTGIKLVSHWLNIIFYKEYFNYGSLWLYLAYKLSDKSHQFLYHIGGLILCLQFLYLFYWFKPVRGDNKYVTQSYSVLYYLK